MASTWLMKEIQFRCHNVKMCLKIATLTVSLQNCDILLWLTHKSESALLKSVKTFLNTWMKDVMKDVEQVLCKNREEMMDDKERQKSTSEHDTIFYENYRWTQMNQSTKPLNSTDVCPPLLLAFHLLKGKIVWRDKSKSLWVVTLRNSRSLGISVVSLLMWSTRGMRTRGKGQG